MRSPNRNSSPGGSLAKFSLLTLTIAPSGNKFTTSSRVVMCFTSMPSLSWGPLLTTVNTNRRVPGGSSGCVGSGSAVGSAAPPAAAAAFFGSGDLSAAFGDLPAASGKHTWSSLFAAGNVRSFCWVSS
eukprot:CAMPEP_0198499466 /NCGR_PEP_ID=MMETSP1462-20131121/7630_1 /TAXON_ID=1333877 /ORGANISM="Brandtodinium nutriculum, Strain RCC3387" /LENGTH=127 /DNA_ID=CAMNT_0044228443 /DNA_START=44 /DNA_END=424 /DNA_ORIENTATION=+